MNKSDLLNATSLATAIRQETKRFHDIKMPSLRIIHGLDPSPVRIDFDADRDEPLQLSRPDGGEVHPGIRDMTKTWLEMMQKTVSPGAVVSFQARLDPAGTEPMTTSPLYFAATVLGVTTWPEGRPWPGDLQFGSWLRVALEHDGGELKVHSHASFGTSAEYLSRLKAEMPRLEDVAQQMDYFWSRCCKNLAPWLDDCGIEKLSMITPIYPAEEPSRFTLGTRVN